VVVVELVTQAEAHQAVAELVQLAQVGTVLLTQVVVVVQVHATAVMVVLV
jgi:hypothetical protein